MFVEGVSDYVANSLDGDQELIGDVEVVRSLLFGEQIVDPPESGVELAYLRLVQILWPESFSKSPQSFSDGLQSLVEGVVDVRMLLKLSDRLYEAVLQIE